MSEKKKNGSMWIGFLLKDRYATDFEKASLKSEIMENFKLNEDDICYVPFEKYCGLSYYFFVRERDSENDLRDIYLFKKDAFEIYSLHVKITNDELNNCMKSTLKPNRGYVKFGDIVRIESGKYSKLNGIVLRENRNGKIEVGMRFCFGTIVEQYDSGNLIVTGNIFNYIKVPN